ncbi:PilZ domain-containing protein [Myxococcota bacterium]|nr:PilZ domain-containing protein [Myxococcota bacterium]
MEPKTLSHNFPFERRNEERFPLVISVKEVSSEGTVLCLSQDISLSGMAIRRASSRTPGATEEVILEFSIPGEEEVIRVPSRYLRAEPRRRFQEGVVLFSQMPAILTSWVSKIFAEGRTAPIMT